MRYTRPLALTTLMAAGVLAFQTPEVEAQTLRPELLEPLNYRSIGPTRQSGRFVDIAVPRQQQENRDDEHDGADHGEVKGLHLLSVPGGTGAHSLQARNAR